ncbi:MAG: hypothetical protein WA431_02205 [Candidatus Cybelea sp.]
MRIPSDIGFTEKFDDLNESELNIGQTEVLDAILFGESIYISGPYKRSGRTRRTVLGFVDGLYLTIVVEIGGDSWQVLSARPSSKADRKRFQEHAIANPNQEST